MKSYLNVILIKKECGMSYFKPNVEIKSLKIVGSQEATPHSWPSMAFVIFSYKFDILINNKKFTETKVFQKILTAAQ